MGGVEIAKINVHFTKCFERSFSKSMVFTMKKLCFVSPDNEIQLIASEINSLRQVRMIIYIYIYITGWHWHGTARMARKFLARHGTL